MAGQIIDALTALDVARNTFVVIWSDHGWKLGEYGAWAKHTNQEIDAREPLIFAGPRVARAKTSQAIVELVDFYPTLSDLSGLATPEHCEGDSFSPALRGADPIHLALAFTQYPTGRGLMGYSVRDVRWRYTEWIQRETGIVVEREIYDHASGPIVARNLVTDPAYTGIRERLARQLVIGLGWKPGRD